VAAGDEHSLAIGWDGRVYSWDKNGCGQLGHGDGQTRRAPALVEGLTCVRGIAAAHQRSLAVTQSGALFTWGYTHLEDPPEELLPEVDDELLPVVVEGFGGVRVCHAACGLCLSFVIGEAGELFSWGVGDFGLLGHGDTRHQPSPKRVEALRGVRVNRVSIG
jgi:alpha-tubulin suppressor-like RCC1 family protein